MKKDVVALGELLIDFTGSGGYAFDPVFGSYPAIQLHFRKKC